MEKVSLICQQKMKKKHKNKLLKLDEAVITQQAIYWILNTFQSITIYWVMLTMNL